jgi:hypothetical protein
MSGFTYANNPENFLLAFGGGSMLSLFALLYLLIKRNP